MEFLQGYASSDEEKNPENNQQPIKKIAINSAPPVLDIVTKDQLYESVNTKEVYYNPKYKALYEPISGPTQPHLENSLNIQKNCWTGFVSSFNINEASFDDQYHRYQSAITPIDTNIQQQLKQTKKRKAYDEKGEYVGPWAKSHDEVGFEILENAINNNNNIIIENNDNNNQKIEDKTKKEKKEEKDTEKDTEKEKKEISTEKSIFHGKEFRDYLGRTYLSPPSELKARNGDVDCFLPKKKIHTWTGHSKGVSAIRFFPKTGHLLLSASLDGKVKLWDVYNQRNVLRTFIGHDKGVKDICWSNDGSKFISGSYDRYIKYWDAETGQCISRFTNGKIPFCVKINPDEDKQDQFLAGCSDKKIIQWDMRSGEIVQEYDRHLGPVNSITFVDENRRFVTSSDDKSIRVWEWGIPVDIKYISEPHMHSMPSVSLSPNQKWLACQSLDNQILIYSSDRFKLNKKKRFKGHLVAGYACQVNFSTDGKYLISGDSDGFLCIWDWKSQKMYKKIKAHDGVCIGVEWHPIEPSRVATCGWDGKIHYWD